MRALAPPYRRAARRPGLGGPERERLLALAAAMTEAEPAPSASVGAGPAQPARPAREGRARRLSDLLILARVKESLAASQFALRLAADFAHDPSALRDIDFAGLARALERERAVVVAELSGRVLASHELDSLVGRIDADARALAVAADGQLPRAEDVEQQKPLRLPLSRLHVPLTLEVSAATGAELGGVALGNASALRSALRARAIADGHSDAQADSLSSLSAALEGPRTDGEQLTAFVRGLWSRLNGRSPDRLQLQLEADANALTRLGREMATLRAELAGTAARTEVRARAAVARAGRSRRSEPRGVRAAAA